MAPLQPSTGIVAILLATSCSAFVAPGPKQTVCVCHFATGMFRRVDTCLDHALMCHNEPTDCYPASLDPVCTVCHKGCRMRA